MFQSGGLSVWQLTLGTLGTNCTVLACSVTREAVVVDCGDESDRVEDLLLSESLIPRGLVATHGHADHIGGFPALRKRLDIPFAIHKADRAMAATKQSAAIVFLGWIPEPIQADRELVDGDEVRVGRCTLRVLHTPGHSPGSICLVGEGLLVAGDLIFAGGVGRTDLPGGSEEEMRRSLTEVLPSLDPALIVLPGHGPNTTLGHELVTNPYVRMYTR